MTTDPAPQPERTTDPAIIAYEIVDEAYELRVSTDDTALYDLKGTIAQHLERIPEDRRAEWLWLLAGQADAWIRAAKLARSAIEYHQLEDLDRNGDIRLGDEGLRVKPARVRKLVSAESLIRWLVSRDGAEALVAAFRLSADNVRITAVRHIAEQHYDALIRAGEVPDDDDERARYVEAIEGTFFDWEDAGHGGRRLDTIPASRAQWVAGLAHGERRPRKDPR